MELRRDVFPDPTGPVRMIAFEQSVGEVIFVLGPSHTGREGSNRKKRKRWRCGVAEHVQKSGFSRLLVALWSEEPLAGWSEP